jgi:hypothetical protein
VSFRSLESGFSCITDMGSATNISLATYELRHLTKEQSLVNNPTLRAEKRLEQIRQKLKLACSQTERLAMLFVNHGVVGCLPMTVSVVLISSSKIQVQC